MSEGSTPLAQSLLVIPRKQSEAKECTDGVWEGEVAGERGSTVCVETARCP